jgi:hypothetical protein
VSKEIVREAIENAKHFNGEYWKKALLQRAGLWTDGTPNKTRAGSYYPDFDPETLEQMLMQAFWKPVKSDNVRPKFQAYTTPLPGMLGVVPLDKLPADTVLRVDDRKHTGYAHLTFLSSDEILADDTTIIVSQKSATWKVVTFFPGDPIDGRRIPMRNVKKPELTIDEAKALGFVHAKMTRISGHNYRS